MVVLVYGCDLVMMNGTTGLWLWSSYDEWLLVYGYDLVMMNDSTGLWLWSNYDEW